MNRIMQLRKEINISQDELAKQLSVHQTAISQWETGRTTPNFEAVEAMCSIFDVSFGYLMGKSEIRGHDNITPEEANELGALIEDEHTLEHMEAYKMLDNHGTAVVDTITRLEIQRIRWEHDQKEDTPT